MMILPFPLPQKVVRDSRLERLLEDLKEEDELFDFHFPQPMRDYEEDKNVLEHVRKTYSVPEFVIDDPKTIQENIQTGDTVRKKGDFRHEECHLLLPQGAEGVIHRTKPDNLLRVLPTAIPYLLEEYLSRGYVRVQFAGHGFHLVLRENLVVYGRQATRLRKRKDWPETQATMMKVIEKGDLVKYTGKDVLDDKSYIVPDGTKGMVCSWIIDRSQNHNELDITNKLDILWERCKRVKQHRVSNTSNFTLFYSPAKHFFTCEEIALIHPNPVDFLQLYKKHYGDDYHEPLSH